MKPRAIIHRLRCGILERQSHVLYATDISALAPPENPRLEIAPFRPQDRVELLDFIDRRHGDVARSRRLLDDCLRHGYHGHLARLDGSIVGHRWWADHRQPHPHMRLYHLCLAPDEAYCFGLYIDSKLRGQGYARELLGAIYRDLSASGLRRVFAAVAVGNTPSRRLQESYGGAVRRHHAVWRLFSTIVICGRTVLRYDPLLM